MKILIIEDEIQLVKSVALALREEGVRLRVGIYSGGSGRMDACIFPGARFCSEAFPFRLRLRDISFIDEVSDSF